MKKIIILSNHHIYTYNFRKEIIERLLNEEYKVYLVLPYGEKIELLKEMGCEFINLPLDRRGMNPIKDLKLLLGYYNIIKKICPDAVLSYTVKPNIYGGIVCGIRKIPFFPNVTGLGTAVENKSFIQKILVKLYKIAYKNATCVFFQNHENKDFFIDRGFNLNKFRVIPGSGVNTEFFSVLPYPTNNEVEFMFISRIMKEKGIDQYLEAAEFIRNKYPYTRFHVLGFCEEEYEDKLKEFQFRGIIQYHGMQNDVREYHKISSCTIHPTYYPEGMSNTLLESAAMGKPIITTDRSGCREIIDNGVNGYVVEQQDSKDLIDKIEMFLSLSSDERMNMGLAGRKKIESEFDRKLVVNAYFEEISSIF